MHSGCAREGESATERGADERDGVRAVGSERGDRGGGVIAVGEPVAAAGGEFLAVVVEQQHVDAVLGEVDGEGPPAAIRSGVFGEEDRAGRSRAKQCAVQARSAG